MAAQRDKVQKYDFYLLEINFQHYSGQTIKRTTGIEVQGVNSHS